MKNKTIFEKDWTEEQNKIFYDLANNYAWNSRTEFYEKLAEEIPEVSATQAMYHASRHLNLKIHLVKRYLEGEALSDASDKLLEGYDSTTTSQYIKKKYGVTLPNTYYSQLRFKLRRGEYVQLPTADGKFCFEHREKAKEEFQKYHNISREKAEEKIRGKMVSHPHSKVDDNNFENLFTTDPAGVYKIRMLNMFSNALGLGYGTLLKEVEAGDFSTKNVDTILKEMFQKVGLDEEAKKRFNVTDDYDAAVTRN